jgi:hypothetical protein
MKTTLLFFTAGILFLSCKNNNQQSEQQKNTDLVQQNLKGAVQRTVDTPYKADSTGNIGAMDSCCVETQELNDSGYVTKYYSKNNSGATKTEQTFMHYPNDGKLSGRIAITIDDNGNYKEAVSYDSTGKQDGYYTDLKQNEFGEITNGKQYKMDSTLKYQWENNFDKNGQYLGGHSDSAGKVTYTSTTTLDSNGNPVKSISMSMVKDTAKYDTTMYRYDKYDGQGNWIQRTALNASGKPVKIVKREITYYEKE